MSAIKPAITDEMIEQGREAREGHYLRQKESAAPKKHTYRNDIDYAPDGTAWSWTVAECECDQPWRHA